MRGLFLLLAFLQSQPTPTPRSAVDRALPILQRSATDCVSQRSCFSCHHNALPILTLRMAKDRGFTIDVAALARIEEKTFAPLRDPDALDQTIQVETLLDPTSNDTLLLRNTALLDALMTAGADPFVPNPEGRNALEQAPLFQHSTLSTKSSSRFRK